MQTKTVNDIWHNFEYIVKQIITFYVPTKTIRSNNFPPWFNGTLIKLKRKCRRQYKTRNCNEKAHLNYKQSFNEFRILSKSQYNAFMFKTLSEHAKENKSAFFQFIKNKNNPYISLPTLKNQDGTLVNGDFEKAELLNKTFASVYSENSSNHAPNVIFHNMSLAFITKATISLTIMNISNAIKALDSKKAPGPDGITIKLLKLAPLEFANYLFILYKECIDKGQLPDQWKVARITPLHKKGDPSNPLNYRPISITSICCKILEKLVNNVLLDHFENNNLFHPSQHGFRRSKSCETQLVKLITNLSRNVDENRQTDLIFIDFERAFDKVPHTILLSKLYSYGT